MLSQFGKTHVIKFTWACILCCFMGGVCLAQNPPKSDAERGQPNRPARQGTDEFWNLLNAASKDASNNRLNLWRLLEHADVQKELGLDEPEFKAIEQLNIKHFEELRALREKFKDSNAKDKLLKELVDVINRQDAAFLDEVAKHCDLKRLIEIDIQAYDLRSVTHAEVAKRVGLSPEKLTELRCLSDQVRRDEMDRMRDVIREGKKVRQLFAEIDKKVNDSLRMKLTSQELDNLQQLRGPVFKLPEDLFEPRRRGGRGPGGGPGGNGGPGSGGPGNGGPGNTSGPSNGTAPGSGDKNRDKENCQ